MSRKKIIIYSIAVFILGVGVGGAGFKVLDAAGNTRSSNSEPRQPEPQQPGSDLSLGQLIVLDGLFGAENGATRKISSLSELIVLNGLFGACHLPRQGSDLGQLIVLDRLFGNQSATSNHASSTVSTLGELIVLDGLFNQSETCVNSR